MDKRKAGTHYEDRYRHILAACSETGIGMHEENVRHRYGGREVVEKVTIYDVEMTPTKDVIVTPQYEKYSLRVSGRVLNRILTMGRQFALALNVPTTTVEVDGNTVYVRVPRPQGDGGLVTFDQAWNLAPGIPRGSLLLGIDDDYGQLVADMTEASCAHAMVIGMTGSGKSTLMRTMIMSAQKSGGTKVALIDPSGGLYLLSGHPSVWRGGMFKEPDDCVWALKVLSGELQGRGGHGFTFVFVDETPDLTMQRPESKEYLARLAQRGRHAGIHLILGAQHPLSTDLSAMTMRNMPLRLTGKVADRTTAYHATGSNKSGAYALQGGGDFVSVNGSRQRHFQAAIVPNEQLAKWAALYPPRLPRIPARNQHEMARNPTPVVESNGTPGRPEEEPCEACVAEIADEWVRTGHRPGRNRIREISTQRHGQMYGDRKCYAAQRMAAGRFGVMSRLARSEP